MSTVREGNSGTSAPPYRIAPQLHQILYKRPGRDKLEPKPEEVLPEPPYPQRPNAKEMTHKEYLKLNGVRMWKTWGAPYFRSRYPSDTVDLILLCGGSARLTNLDQYISYEMGIPTEVADPFKNVSVSARGMSGGARDEVAPAFAIALGLAARDAILGS